MEGFEEILYIHIPPFFLIVGGDLNIGCLILKNIVRC